MLARELDQRLRNGEDPARVDHCGLDPLLGKPIRKPWTIATSMRDLNLLCRKCEHEPSEHAPCAGSDTNITEGYTDELVINLHAAVKRWCDVRRAP